MILRSSLCPPEYSRPIKSYRFMSSLSFFALYSSIYLCFATFISFTCVPFPSLNPVSSYCSKVSLSSSRSVSFCFSSACLFTSLCSYSLNSSFFKLFQKTNFCKILLYLLQFFGLLNYLLNLDFTIGHFFLSFDCFLLYLQEFLFELLYLFEHILLEVVFIGTWIEVWVGNVFGI